MIVHRTHDEKHGITRVLIYPDARHEATMTAHEVICAEFDYSEEKGRHEPSARVHLLGTGSPLYFEDIRRISDDYAVIADIAMKLEAEKRAAYSIRFS